MCKLKGVGLKDECLGGSILLGSGSGAWDLWALPLGACSCRVWR